jgi:hypothetical protein
VLLWAFSELDVEGVIPNLLHVVEAIIVIIAFFNLDNTALNGVRNMKDVPQFLSLLTDVLIFALLTNDRGDKLGSANDGREYSSGSIFT